MARARPPGSTRHYTKISPARLAKAYSDAGHVARSLRTIEVLLDRDAVTSGAGEPWQYYDLGTAGAPAPSPSSARTGWPAPAAASARRRTSARPSSWKPSPASSA